MNERTAGTVGISPLYRGCPLLRCFRYTGFHCMQLYVCTFNVHNSVAALCGGYPEVLGNCSYRVAIHGEKSASGFYTMRVHEDISSCKQSHTKILFHASVYCIQTPKLLYEAKEIKYGCYHHDDVCDLARWFCRSLAGVKEFRNSKN